MTTAAKKTTSIALAALLAMALVPISAPATSQQAWGDEASDGHNVANESLTELDTALSDSTAENDKGSSATELKEVEEEVSALSLGTLEVTHPIQNMASYSDFTLQDGKKISYKTSSTSDEILDFDFSLSAMSTIAISLNAYDHGSEYYNVCIFSLYNSEDKLLDTIYADHNSTVDARWILPAGSYYIRYLSLDFGYKQTVTIGYDIVESGTAEYQMTPSYIRTKEEAPTITIGSKYVLGVNFWGYAQTVSNEDLDGHYYKINLTEKSALDIAISSVGKTGIGLYNSSDQLMYAAYTNGTATSTDAAGFTTAELNPGTYFVFVSTSDYRALGTPYLFAVEYAKTSLSKASVTPAKSAYTYTGKDIKPGATVRVGGKTLKSGTDYTVSYKSNKAVGTATVTVTGKGAYTGSKSATFKINPKGTAVKGKVKAGKKSFTVKWAKLSKANLKQATGYQVRYSLKKNMKGAKVKAVKATSSAGKKCTLKVSKLKGGKKYYVQVRTYKKVGGKTYYSGWSKAKTVKVKK